MTGIAVVFGYALLGATWLIMKTDDVTQEWSPRVASYVLAFVGVFMTLVSIAMPFMNERVRDLWFLAPNIYILSLIPLLTAALLLLVWRDLHRQKAEYRPFLSSIGIFLLGYLGLGISIFPWLVPFKYTIWDAAASGPGPSLMLVGVIPALPLILVYTAYAIISSAGKPAMNTCIKDWMNRHPRAREWAWFITLWLGGLMAVSAIAYPIKMVIKGME